MIDEIGVGGSELKKRSREIINECVELQELGRFQQIDGTNKTYNYVFVNSLVIMDPDKHCTWSKVPRKQIVLRLRTSSGIYHS